MKNVLTFDLHRLGVINADIGPNANVTWVSLVYTLTLAIGLLLVGRLSDLFG